MSVYTAEETRDLKLAVALGYTQYTNALLTGGYSVMSPAEYVLPVKPFTRIWPFVIVREVVMNGKGQTVRTKHGDAQLRRKIRLLPR